MGAHTCSISTCIGWERSKLRLKFQNKKENMATTSNVRFIDFCPNVSMLFYFLPLDPCLLNRESYYFEHRSIINGRHVNASACY